jgi:hypothetical protein
MFGYGQQGARQFELQRHLIRAVPSLYEPERADRAYQRVLGFVAGVDPGFVAGVAGNGFWKIGAEVGLAAAVGCAAGLVAGATVAAGRVLPAGVAVRMMVGAENAGVGVISGLAAGCAALPGWTGARVGAGAVVLTGGVGVAGSTGATTRGRTGSAAAGARG